MSNSLKLKIGAPATGEHYFQRRALQTKLIKALKRDHIAFLGPRRTGKTSILRELQRNPPEGTSALYLDIQGLNNVPAWLSLMLNETKKLLPTEPDKLAWLKEAGKGIASLMKRIESFSLGKIKLTLTKPDVEHWEPMADEFLNLLLVHKLPIIYMLDEFPWFLSNIAAKHSKSEVAATLNWFRKARQVLAGGPTRFLVTGSIGLAGLLRKLELSSTANDFDSINIKPLTDKEALEFLQKYAEGEGITLSAAASRRILERIGIGWPMLLAIFLSEIQDQDAPKGPTVKDIDRIYEEDMVRGRRNKYCEEMFNRLNKPEMFSRSEFRLAQEILCDLCKSTKALGRDDFEDLHARLVPDPAHRGLIASELDYVLETLRHDGYLVRQQDGFHVFSSHILRDFWSNRTA